MKKLIIPLIFVLFLCSCFPLPNFDNNTNDQQPKQQTTLNSIESNIQSQLQAQGYEINNVYYGPEGVLIDYQEDDYTSEQDMRANWAYMFSVAVENTNTQPDTSINVVNIISTFDNGETITAMSNVNNIVAFMNGELSSADFLYNLDLVYKEEGAPDV